MSSTTWHLNGGRHAGGGERWSSQALLIGETLYLRPLDPSDAETAPRWSSSPWPAPPDVVKERIEQQLGNDLGAQFRYQRFLVCRRSDDEPVGGVDLAFRSEATLPALLRVWREPFSRSPGVGHE